MCSHYIVMHNSILFSMYQVLPSGHRSTLIQRWASTFLNHRQRWYLVEKSLILKQLSTKNQLLNHNSTKNQPSLKLKCQLENGWNLVDSASWFLVELWLRSWFLVDHCFKINDFSTKYQRWYLVEKLICAHRVQPVYTQRTLSHSIFYPLFSGCWWSGSPTPCLCWL